MNDPFRRLPIWAQSIAVVLATLVLTAIGLGLLIGIGLLWNLAGKVWGW